MPKLNNVPSQDDLEGRFSFIDNEILKENIVIALRYVFFLKELEEERELPGPFSYSIYKNIILHIAAIVEAVIHYCVKFHLDNGIIKNEEAMSYQWSYRDAKKAYEISESEVLYTAVKYKKFERFGKSTRFQDLNRISRRINILTEDLFSKAEKLKEERNKIHLAGLKTVDDYYEKGQVESALKDAMLIIVRVEKMIQKY